MMFLGNCIGLLVGQQSINAVTKTVPDSLNLLCRHFPGCLHTFTMASLHLEGLPWRPKSYAALRPNL
jgi:hypothetical protein